MARYKETGNWNCDDSADRSDGVASPFLAEFADDRDAVAVDLNVTDLHIHLAGFPEHPLASHPSDLTQCALAFGDDHVTILNDVVHHRAIEGVTLDDPDYRPARLRPVIVVEPAPTPELHSGAQNGRCSAGHPYPTPTAGKAKDALGPPSEAQC
ncbi:hypothetical protein [Pacificimonas flava]|uniref:hypothetical protein n=1 Tax=Pacificimonas flava TaxID=1234595 RepID=UPI00122E7B34|nr:hypothetical protein [Pacificimonas flava]MBB5281675.1 hypothetical protein [Pacificimonas flava]